MKKAFLSLASLFLCMVGTSRGGESAPFNGYSLEPAKMAAWWHMGEDVSYRLQGSLPGDLSFVEGVVADVSGNEVARIKVDRETVQSQGWSWQPTQPGYYEVKFASLDAKGGRTAIGRSYTLRAPNGAKRDFQRDKCAFAVLPPPLEPESGVGQFGVICDNPEPDDIPLARLIGFDATRLLVPWGATFTNLTRSIEPVKGEYHWEILDPAVDAFTQAGFNIYAQFLYTPVWASPHPEEANVINICVRQATAYAPKDLADFARFVAATVTRYKDRIHTWEIWNEPSIPGGSCFWSDTVENYVKLLQTGYEAVKQADPDGKVAFGGLGESTTYQAFYDQVLKLGGAKYFDLLSLHGKFTTPDERFREIEAANGVAPKPGLQTEWHAVLQGNNQSTPLLSEPALSFRMMQDLLYQLKHGVQKTLLFEMKNLNEKETIGFCIENKWFTHSSGIFRRTPWLEPRQPAVVLANFLDLAGHRAAYVREFSPGGDAVAIELSTAHGPLVVFWGEQAPLALSSLKPFATGESILRDWEGKSLAFDAASSLENHKIYYLTAANAEATARTTLTDLLVSPRATVHAGQNVPQAAFSKGKLFGTIDDAATVSAEGWIGADWKLTKLLAHDPGFSARAGVGVHEGGLDIVIEVHDPVQCQTNSGASLWKGDSVQIAVDCEGRGFVGGNAEFLTALTDQGSVTWKIAAADPHGDIPMQWSPGNGPAKYVQQKVSHEGTVTLYKVRIPWTELFPLTYDPARPLRLAIVVNNDNREGRSEYMEWGGGITGEKEPSLYGRLRPMGEK